MLNTNHRKQDLLINTGTAIMGVYARLFLNIDIFTQSHIPPGPKIFACNHPTTTDPFLISLLTNEPVRILVTGGAFLVPGLRDYLQGAGHIPINRGEGRGQEVIDQALQTLNEGKSVCIFPEGQLSPDEGAVYGVADAHSGVGRIALASGAPVIPIGVAVDKSNIIILTKEFDFTDGPAIGRWVGSGPYAVTIGKLLSFTGNPGDYGEVQMVGERVIGEIRQLTAMSRRRLPRRSYQVSLRAKLWNLLFSFMKQVTV
jgi:1-acyl-sn-glycerol-3-phosphate acyltransferase